MAGPQDPLFPFNQGRANPTCFMWGALLLIGCVTLDKWLNNSDLRVPVCKMGIVIQPIS